MKPAFKMLDRSIIKDLSSGDEFTVQDLRYKHGVTNQKIRGSLTRLCNQGLVERVYYDEQFVACYRLNQSNMEVWQDE